MCLAQGRFPWAFFRKNRGIKERSRWQNYKATKVGKTQKEDFATLDVSNLLVHNLYIYKNTQKSRLLLHMPQHRFNNFAIIQSSDK